MVKERVEPAPHGAVVHVPAFEMVVAREIVIKGQVIGKLLAEQSLTIHGTAEIKGSFQTPLLIVPSDNAVHWRDGVQVGAVAIRGELVSNVDAATTVTVHRNGRLFGNVRARALVVEEGAVLVGEVNVHADPKSHQD